MKSTSLSLAALLLSAFTAAANDERPVITNFYEGAYNVAPNVKIPDKLSIGQEFQATVNYPNGNTDSSDLSCLQSYVMGATKPILQGMDCNWK